MLRRARAADSQLEIIEPLMFSLDGYKTRRIGTLLGEVWWDINAILPSFQDITCAASVRNALHRDRRSFAAADAECGDAAFQVMRLQRMQQRDDQAGACCADGMAERAGAAIDVQLLAVDAEIALCCHRHHGEGLVDLEQVDIADAPADLVEQFSDRRDRRGGEPLRLLTVGGVAL